MFKDRGVVCGGGLHEGGYRGNFMPRGGWGRGGGGVSLGAEVLLTVFKSHLVSSQLKSCTGGKTQRLRTSLFMTSPFVLSTVTPAIKVSHAGATVGVILQ